MTNERGQLRFTKYNYSQVPIKRVGPNKRVGWIFKYINFIKEYLGPNNPRVEGKICYSIRVENENK